MIARDAQAADLAIELAAVAGDVSDARDGRDAFAIAGVAPRLVVRPADRDELGRVVATIAALGASLVPVGLGAHRELGHAPTRYDVALSTARLQSARDYTPADMTVTVDAGMTVAALQRLLAGEGQWLPVAPPLPEQTTVGGLIAADLGGPLRASQGRVRDFVIGIAATLVDGRMVRGGGKVVKNVAGYDLMKLLIGSLGTLAVVVEATFKVKPIPAVRRCLALDCADPRAALTLAEAIADRDLGSLGATIVLGLGDDRTARAVFALGGVDTDVDAERAGILSSAPPSAAVVIDADADDPQARAVTDELRDYVRRAPHALVIRFAATRRSAIALASALTEVCAATPGRCLVDPRAGTIVLALLEAGGGGGRPDSAGARAALLLGNLGELAIRHGAHVVVERSPAELADMVVVWSPLPSALPLMRRMKDAFDPRGTLAPGRFVGRI
jgi:glycolate oxidase FAD binding subunit